MPVINVAYATSVIVVPRPLPAATLRDLIDYARVRPHQLHYASSGVGSANHVDTEVFAALAGIELIARSLSWHRGRLSRAARRRGAGDVRGRHVGAVARRGGKGPRTRGADRQRSPVLPEVPTLAEAGLPDVDVRKWFGLVAPAAHHRHRDPPQPRAERQSCANRRCAPGWTARASKSPAARPRTSNACCVPTSSSGAKRCASSVFARSRIHALSRYPPHPSLPGRRRSFPRAHVPVERRFDGPPPPPRALGRNTGRPERAADARRTPRGTRARRDLERRPRACPVRFRRRLPGAADRRRPGRRSNASCVDIMERESDRPRHSRAATTTSYSSPRLRDRRPDLAHRLLVRQRRAARG